MEEITQHIQKALAEEEARVEKSIFDVRLALLLIFAVLAAVNVHLLPSEINFINFGILLLAGFYKLVLYLVTRRRGYRPVIKYVTSFMDIFLIYLVMILYAQIYTPAVALKNYVFFLLFPVIVLTVFRYNLLLTWFSGGLAFLLYLGMFLYLYLSDSITMGSGGYMDELFSENITFIGQLTKGLMLFSFVALAAFLAQYTRRLFDRLVVNEVRTRREKELMERELEIASQVQKKLLPNSFPKISSLDLYGTVLPGRFVGGDYYDFLPLSDTAVLLVAADVAGKGVPAALIMSEVRGATHLLSSMKLPLSNLVQQLNSLLYASMERNYFVSYFAAVVDTAGGTVRYVNAGHPPPLLISEGRISALANNTLALGFLPVLPQIKEFTEAFPPGSMVLAYTDGVWEHTDGAGEQFGEERLKEFTRNHSQLNAKAFVEQLLEDIRTFGRGRELDDDVTIAVAKSC